MNNIETMKLALEALEANQPVNYCVNNNGEKFPMMQEDPFKFERNTKAITALRQAIEQAQQAEPFGYFQFDLRLDAWVQNRHSDKGVAFYTSPPPRQPLTDKELNLIGLHWHYNLLGKDDKAELFAFARAIEAAHGIKEKNHD
jgi:hypothetical protein